MEREKKYVPVLVRFDAEGKMRPVEIEFEEGQVFAVDRILDVRRAACQSVGGVGDATPAESWARKHTFGLKRDAGLWRQKYKKQRHGLNQKKSMPLFFTYKSSGTLDIPPCFVVESPADLHANDTISRSSASSKSSGFLPVCNNFHTALPPKISPAPVVSTTLIFFRLST